MRQLCKVIPGGVNSPVRSCKSMGQMPMVVDHASGDISLMQMVMPILIIAVLGGALFMAIPIPSFSKQFVNDLKKGRVLELRQL